MNMLYVTIRPKKAQAWALLCIFSLQISDSYPLDFYKKTFYFQGNSISEKLIIAGSALDKKDLPVVGISNPQHDWIRKAKSTQH